MIAVPALPAVVPARVQVRAEEFRFSLSRPAIVAGPAVVELVNYGEDVHDLALRRGTGPTRRIPRVSPGHHREIETSLPPGRYALWCTIADHRSRGMRATLIVRGRR